MNALESWLLTYLLNSLWQVPLIFAAAWLAARLVQYPARRKDAALEHRIWVGALLLEALLPACALTPAQLFQSLSSLVLRAFAAPSTIGDARVTVLTGAGYARGVLHLPSQLLACAVFAYIGCVAYFAARLLWRLSRTAALRRASQPIVLAQNSQASWDRCRRAFSVPNAQLAASAAIAGPITIGIRRRMVLLPAGMLQTLPDDDLSAALAHEFAHMRRRDFAKNLFYELLSLPIAWHPLLWLTRARLAESREMVCDALAASAAAGRAGYARSLLRLASMLPQACPARTLHAIGIFDANTLERRIMNLTEKQIELRGPRRLTTVAACIAIGLGTCASAMTLRMGIAAPAAQNESHSPSSAKQAAHVANGVMEGNLLSHVNPVYPPMARAAKVSGSVVLRAIIGKDGTMQDLKVLSGPQMLMGSALEAVHQWRYKPYLINGNPTEVETTITVNFSLANAKHK